MILLLLTHGYFTVMYLATKWMQSASEEQVHASLAPAVGVKDKLLTVFALGALLKETKT